MFATLILMGFERFSPESIDFKRARREVLSPAMERVHAATQHELFRKPEYAIHMDEFRGIYAPEEMAKDAAYATRLEMQWANEHSEQEKHTKKIAEVFEGLVLFNTRGGNWFGDASVLKTTPYDDYVNGTDMIAHLRNASETPQTLALAVDVTFGTTGLKKKFNNIYKEIDENTAGSLKYYRNPSGTERGPLHNKVARVVVGVGQEVVEDLARLTIQRTAESIQVLRKHPIQALIAEQIYMQLLVAQSYARDTGRDVAAEAYGALIPELEALRAMKGHISTRSLEKDLVHEGIMKALETRASESPETAG